MAHGEEGGGSTMGGKILTILLVVVFLGVVLYFWNSGLVGSSTNGISSLFHLPSSTSTIFSSTTPPGFGTGTGFGDITGGTGVNNFGNGGGAAVAPEPTPIAPPFDYGSSPVSPTTISSPGINPSEIPSGFTAAQLSPYFKEIVIGGAYGSYGGFGFGSSYGAVTLYANLSQNETVDVTGWQLKSHTGSEYVPQAVEVYQPSGFAPAQDIHLGSGQTLYLYSSPGTINLRLNECIGYLEKDLNTNPQLPLTCPYINQSQISNFTGQCQNYILSIPACTVPDNNSLQIPQTDYACQQYLNTMNYGGCFNAHVSDANFLSNQWWAWTGTNIAGSYHDVIQLFDRSGLLVDQYSY